MNVVVVHKFTKLAKDAIVIDACDNNPNGEFAGINPFLVGPCPLYDGLVSMTMENGWQYTKVYSEYAQFFSGTDPKTGNDRTIVLPSEQYWVWANRGWTNPISVRYPMGKGRAPLFCLWKGEHLGYVDSRKKIYGPLFVKAVRNTTSYARLEELAKSHPTIYIRDWDGWNMQKHKMSDLSDVLNCTTRKMGHAFFLKAMLENDKILDLLDF
jgi:hypothetical protein